jgi:hypothetical protein
VGVSRSTISSLREAGAQGGKALGCRVSRDGLWQELPLHLQSQQRLNLFGRIGAGAQCAFHHDPGVLNHFLTGIVLEDAVGQIRGQRQADQEGQQQNQIEFHAQTHESTPQ